MFQGVTGKACPALLGIAEIVGGGVIAGVAIAEAVGEDLVDDGVGRPSGGFKVGIVNIDVPALPQRRAHLRHLPGTAGQVAAIGKVEVGGAIRNLEFVVEHRRQVAHGKRCLPPGADAVAGNLCHGERLACAGGQFINEQTYFTDIVGGGAQTQRHRAAGGLRPAWVAELGAAAVVVERVLVDQIIAHGVAHGGFVTDGHASGDDRHGGDNHADAVVFRRVGEDNFALLWHAEGNVFAVNLSAQA